MSRGTGLWRDPPGMVPPFFRIVFYLEPFWAFFPSNPVKSAQVAIFESADIGTFVRAESAVIEIGSQNAIRG